jgi:hypothetical protein
LRDAAAAGCAAEIELLAHRQEVTDLVHLQWLSPPGRWRVQARERSYGGIPLVSVMIQDDRRDHRCGSEEFHRDLIYWRTKRSFAGFHRFLVALPPMPDLLLRAKHLFVAAMAASDGCAARGQGSARGRY